MKLDFGFFKQILITALLVLIFINMLMVTKLIWIKMNHAMKVEAKVSPTMLSAGDILVSKDDISFISTGGLIDPCLYLKSGQQIALTNQQAKDIATYLRTWQGHK
jgi:hypothetical protein